MKKTIISRFKERPRTKMAWWAMGLGLGAIFGGPLLGTFAAAIRPLIDRATNEAVGAGVGFGLGIVVLALPVAALIMGIRALKQGERSWALWVGFIPAILAGLFWIFMIVGEFAFPH